MIGFAPWGIVWNRDELVVPDNTINYGYEIRKPVEMLLTDIPQEKQNKAAHLDKNHTHFVLVQTENYVCEVVFLC